jgi:ATPase family associated with various cellular activities (AAA)
LPPLLHGKLPENWSRITGFLDREFHATKAAEATEGNKDARKKAIAEHIEDIVRKIVCLGLEKVIEEEASHRKTEDDAASGGENPLPGTPDHTVLCPFETHGKIKTAFRTEIESFASIRRIIEKYLNDETWTSPLSIAVFGPPGAGKSFTITQILGTVNADIAKRPLEYNVAQFTDPKDLETAFRKVQDEAVSGEVPLVFFDEFDASFGRVKLRWLKFFLAPMQDGKFKAGESTYRIGRAIFVFAGGISKSWYDFYEKHKKDKDKNLLC